jgi:hypothetical protein
MKLNKIRVGKIIGEIGVDAGTVMIADPCYFIEDERFPNDPDTLANRVELNKAFEKGVDTYTPIQANYPAGHAGLAILSPTSDGDGVYNCVDLVDDKNRKVGIGVLFGYRDGRWSGYAKYQLNNADIMNIGILTEKIIHSSKIDEWEEKWIKCDLKEDDPDGEYKNKYLSKVDYMKDIHELAKQLKKITKNKNYIEEN